MNEVTRLLYAIDGGNPLAAAQLLPLVYDELRRLAARKLAHEKPGQTLNPTALVHEAYLRLVEPNDARAFANSKHFLLAAAEAMQRILVENARRKKRRKHGGGRLRVDVETVDLPDWNDNAELVLAVHEALQRLAEEDASVAEVVRLRWFAGLSVEQTAAALGLSVRTVNRHWAYARAWLYQQLKPEGGDEMR